MDYSGQAVIYDYEYIIQDRKELSTLSVRMKSIHWSSNLGASHSKANLKLYGADLCVLTHNTSDVCYLFKLLNKFVDSLYSA